MQTTMAQEKKKARDWKRIEANPAQAFSPVAELWMSHQALPTAERRFNTA